SVTNQRTGPSSGSRARVELSISRRLRPQAWSWSTLGSFMPSRPHGPPAEDGRAALRRETRRHPTFEPMEASAHAQRTSLPAVLGPVLSITGEQEAQARDPGIVDDDRIAA